MTLRAVPLLALCIGVVPASAAEYPQHSQEPSVQVNLGCDFSDYSPIERRALKALVKATPEPHPHCYYRRPREKVEALVRVLVRNDGRPTKVCIVEGHALCAPAAAEAVWKWRFKAWPTKTGQPTYAVHEIRFRFVLPKSAQEPEPKP